MFVFKKKYFFLGSLLLVLEVLIALYLHDRIIRPYVGDLLVVIMIYCFARAFLNASALTIGLCVLVFAYVVETLQYFKLVHFLGLRHSRIANIIMGNSFEWLDMIAYSLGIVMVLFVEHFITSIPRPLHCKSTP